MTKLQSSAQRIAASLRKRDRTSMRALIERVTVERERIVVEVKAGAIAEKLGLPPSVSPNTILQTIDASIRRTGRSLKLVQASGRGAAPESQDHLVRLLAKGRLWWSEMLERNLTAAQLAARHGVTKTYVSRVVRLNFLSPRIVEAILAGKHPVDLDAKRLLIMHNLPLAWPEQEKAILC